VYESLRKSYTLHKVDIELMIDMSGVELVEMKKVRVFCTIRPDLVAWIDQEVEKGTFHNRSHALEASLILKRESMKKQ